MRLSLVSSLSVVVISLAVFLPFHHVEACSRIFWNSNGQAMLVARNMDVADWPFIYVMPAGKSKTGGNIDNPAKWTSKYGSVVMAYFGQVDYMCDEGINTQGLAFHYLVLEGSEYETRDSRPGVDGGRYGQYLLDNAANVTEALKLMSQTQLVIKPLDPRLLLRCHVALEDAAGDSAVVEFIGGRMVVYHGSNYTVLTNAPPFNEQLDNLTRYRKFGGDLPWPGDVESKDRFVRASAFLSTLNSQPFPPLHANLISRLFSAIRAVAPPFGSRASDGESWPTIWTSLFDLTHKTIYFTDTVAKNNFWIDMKKLKLAPGAPVLYLEAYWPDLFGEVSGLFSPVK
ncbi:MAG: linear amide C-N hydrolase [Deltaproteobacteria bacterium]|nr:linear amide C-N hydrolase [Deltaproteobacteria bacterium]